jgi:hypothetical protein
VDNKRPVNHQYTARLAALLGIAPAASIVLASVTGLSWPWLFAVVSTPALLVLIWLLTRNPVAARHLAIGAAAGLVGTVAYDAVRYTLKIAGHTKHPFKAIELYGTVLVGPSYVGSATGWTFHFWNGVMFGIFFHQLIRCHTLLHAIAWGMFLELALVATVPKLLKFTITDEFITLGIIGHVFYGVGLWATIHAGTRRNNV